MKRNTISVLCAAAMAALLVTGCGEGSPSAGQSAGRDAASATAAETSAESRSAERESSSPAQESFTGAQESSSPAQETSPAQEAASAAEIPEDGVYSAEFSTDTSMFHVNEAYDGKGTLTVENGRMTIHVSLASKHIVNLFAGTAEDAQKDGADILQPTTDTVTYSDGYTENVYGFDIPVPALDQEFDVAILGTKGKWYDHKVTVGSPQPDQN